MGHFFLVLSSFVSAFFLFTPFFAWEVGPWELQEDESIVAVEQINHHVGCLGQWICFHTSPGPQGVEVRGLGGFPWGLIIH